MSETYDKLNHWDGWNGGECPVHPETVVECAFDDGLPDLCVTAKRANDYCWGPISTIIVFRIIKLHVDPKVIWVNEHDGKSFAYSAKSIAEMSAGRSTRRIAVRYVEQPL
mgnify:CR=1 FL=1